MPKIGDLFGPEANSPESTGSESSFSNPKKRIINRTQQQNERIIDMESNVLEGAGRSQYDEGLLPGEDYQESRAQQQSRLDRWASVLPRIAVGAVAKAGQGIGYTGALLANGFDVNAAVDNGFSKFFENMDEGIKEALPVYTPRAIAEGNILDKLGSASFWTNDVADGVAFMLSSYIPAGLIGKAGMGLKAANAFSRAFGTAKAGWLSAPNIAKLANGLDQATSAAIMTSGEALFEAKDTRDEVRNALAEKLGKAYNELTDEERAGVDEKAANAAANTFNLNMAALAPSNLLEMSYLFKAAGRTAEGASRAGNEMIDLAGDVAKRYVPETRMGKFLETKTAAGLKGALASSASEGLYEENVQHSIQKLTKEYGIEGKAMSLLGTAMNELPSEMINNITDKDGLTAIVTGALIGGPTGGVGGYREHAHKQKAADAAVEAINNAYAGSKSLNLWKRNEDGSLQFDDNGDLVPDEQALQAQANNSLEFQQLGNDIEAFRKAGHETTAQILENERFGKLAQAHFEAGKGEEFFAKLESMKNATDEELMGMGINPVQYDRKKNRIPTSQIIEGWKEQALQYEELYNNVKTHLVDTTGGGRTNMAYQMGARGISLEKIIKDKKEEQSRLAAELGDSEGARLNGFGQPRKEMRVKYRTENDLSSIEQSLPPQLHFPAFDTLFADTAYGTAENADFEKVVNTFVNGNDKLTKEQIEDVLSKRGVKEDIINAVYDRYKTEVIRKNAGSSTADMSFYNPIYAGAKGTQLLTLDKRIHEAELALGDLKYEYGRLVGTRGNEYFNEKKQAALDEVTKAQDALEAKITGANKEALDFYNENKDNLIEVEHNGKSYRGKLIPSKYGYAVQFDRTGTGAMVTIPFDHTTTPHNVITGEQVAEEARKTEENIRIDREIREQREAIEEELAAIEEFREGLQTEIDEAQFELDATKERVEYLKNLSKEKQTKELFREQKRLKEKIKQISPKINKLIQDRKERIAALNAREEYLQKKLDILPYDLETSMKEEIKELGEDIAGRKKTINLLTRAIAEFQEQLKHLLAQYREFALTVKEKIKQYEESIAEMEGWLQDEWDAARTLHPKISKEAFNEWVKEYAPYKNLADSIQELKDELASFRKQANQQKATFGQLQRNNQNNIEKATESIRRLERMNKDAQAQIKRNQNALAGKPVAAINSDPHKDEEITPQVKDEKVTLIDFIAKGFKKITSLFYAAGAHVRYALVNGKYENLYDEDGKIILTDKPDQLRYYNFVNGNWNPEKGDDVYEYKLVLEHPDKPNPNEEVHFNKDNTNTGERTIWAVVYKNGEPVFANEKGEPTTPENGKLVYTTLHNTSYITKTAVAETQKGESAEDTAKRVALHKADYDKFRRDAIDNPGSFVKITHKNPGHLNLLKNKPDGTRMSENVRGRLFPSKDSLNKHKSLFAISKTIQDGKPFVVINGETYPVPVAGKLWYLANNNGVPTPVMLVGRKVNKSEATMVVELLKTATFVDKEGKGGFTASKTIATPDGKNARKILPSKDGPGLLGSIVYWGKSKNPATQIYLENTPDGVVIRYGENGVMTIEELNSNPKPLVDFLLTKEHQISEKHLASEKGYFSPTAVKDGVITGWDVFKAEEGGYLAYLTEGTKTLKDGTVKNRDKVVGTDMQKIGENQFVQANLEYSPQLYNGKKEPINKPATQAKVNEAGEELANQTETQTTTVTENPFGVEGFEQADASDESLINSILGMVSAKEQNESQSEVPSTVADLITTVVQVEQQETSEDNPFADLIGDVLGVVNQNEKNETPPTASEEDAFNSLYREVNTSVDEYEKTDIETEIAEVSRMLDVPVKRVKGIIKNKAWGMFSDGLIYLSEEMEAGTAYHEVFHAVSQMYLSRDERSALYSEVRARDGKNYTDLEAEERLAEDFRDFVMSGGKLKFGKKQNNFFQELWNMIKALISGKPDIDTVFANIYAGAYKNGVRKAKGKGTFYRKVNGTLNGNPYELPVNDFKDMMESLTAMFFSKISEDGFSEDALNAKSTGIYQAIHTGLKSYLSYKTVKTPAQTFMLENWDIIKNLHKSYLQRFDITVKEEEDNTEDDITSRDGHDSNFKPHIEFSSKHGMPKAVKLLIAGLFEKNAKGEVLKNTLTFNKPVDFNKTYNILSRELAGLADYDKMMSKLRSMSYKYPFAADIIARLDGIKDVHERTDLQTKFFQAFAKSKNEYLTTLTGKNGIRYVNSDSQLMQNRIKDKWRAAFKSSRAEFYDSENGGIRQDKVNELLRMDSRDMLETLGVSFTNSDTWELKAGDKTIADIIATDIKTEFNKAIKNGYPLPADIFDMKPISKRLRQLVEEEAKNNVDIFELQHMNPEGKTVYSITLNNFLSSMINGINNYTNWEEFIAEFPMFNPEINKYAANSTWLKQIKTAFDTGNKGFALNLMEGLREDAVGEEGTVTSELTPPDMATQQINALLRTNFSQNAPVFTFLRASDKKLEYGFSGFKILDIDESDFTYNGESFDFMSEEGSVMDIFYGYFTDEADRIKRTKSGDIGKNIEIYKGKAEDFSVFDDILPADLKDRILKQIDNDIKSGQGTNLDSFRPSIEAAVNDYLNKQTLANLKYVVDNKLYDPTTTKKNFGINEEVFKKYGGIEGVMAAFTVNDLISSIEQVKLFTGDMAFYKDFFKRTSGLIGTGKVSRTDNTINEYINTDSKWNKVANGKFSVITLRDLDKVGLSSVYVQHYAAKVGELMMKDLLKANGLTTPNQKIKDEVAAAVASITKQYSEINEADAQGYITLQEYREYKIRMDGWSKKQQDAYERLVAGTGTSEDLASFTATPLKPQYFGPVANMDMYHQGYLKLSLMPLIPQMTKDSQLENLRKSMERNAQGIAVFESGNKTGASDVENLYNDNGEIEDREYKSAYYDYRFMKDQQDIFVHEENKVIFGTQMRKLIFSNLFENGNDRGTLFNGKTATEVFDEWNRIHDNLIDNSLDELTRELGFTKQQVADGDYTIGDYETIKKFAYKEAKQRGMPDNILEVLEGNQKVYFDAIPNKERVEYLMMSIVNNRLIKQKMNGNAYVQGASTGFETKARKFNTLSEQQQGEIDWKKGTNGLRFLYHEDGTVKGAQVLLPSYLKGVVDIKNVDERLLRLIGYRIPTQGLNSILHLEVAGFLPESAGNLIIVPSEIVVQAGSDFDIDKLQIFLPNVRDGKYVEYTEGTTDTQAMQNRLMELAYSILENESSFVDQITPNGAGTLKELAEKVRTKKPKSELNAKSPTRNIEWKKKLDTGEEFWGGKTGVGQVAVHNTHHILAQRANLYMKVDGINFPHNTVVIDGKAYPSLAGVYDATNTKKITSILGEFLTAFVDIAKDPFIFELNATSYTNNMIFMMTRLGCPIEYTAYFMNQPIIRDYLKAKRIAESTLVESNSELKSTYKDSQIKKQLLEKYSSEVAPKESYSTEELLSFIDKTEGDDFNAAQTQMLTDFLYYIETAKQLQDAVRASSDDTKGAGKTLIETQLMQNLKEKVIESNTIGNFEKIFENTFVGSFQRAARFPLKAYKELYLTENDDIKEAIDHLIDIVSNKRMGQNDMIDTVKKIRNGMMAWIINNYGKVKVSEDYLNKLFKNYSNSDSYAKQLAIILNDPKSNLGILADVLQPVLSEKDINNIRLNTKRVDTWTANLITEGFRELQATNPTLYGKIATIALYQDGQETTQNSFREFIPNESYMKVVNEAIANFLNDSAKDLRYAKAQIFETNSKDKNLVPVKTFGIFSKIPISEGILTLNSKFGTEVHFPYVMTKIETGFETEEQFWVKIPSLTSVDEVTGIITAKYRKGTPKERFWYTTGKESSTPETHQVVQPTTSTENSVPSSNAESDLISSVLSGIGEEDRMVSDILSFINSLPDNQAEDKIKKC